MTRIYDKKTRDVMIAAMHKRTKIGCEQLVQNSRYSKLYQEKLFEKYTTMGVVSTPTFTSAFASHLYKSAGILS